MARLDELIDRVRTAGATIELTVTGDPVVLAPGLDLCVYRVIQESLTNVLKHADPPIATVALHWHPEELTVRITDRGKPARTPQEVEVTGHGLIGMRERARIYGGKLDATALPQGGFRITLTLPTGERDS
ncbi:MAG TPA: hypothetical protein DGG94_00700 [Micromonosporaceae bacterium]|nr:hypothetical protein [Micromonosporaceae bacterium]